MATNAQILGFMELFGRLAVAECNRRIAAGKGFILPSVAMAQSALESDWGQAGLMKRANAFFGVKAGGSWTGKVYSASTWEVVEGEVHNITANFRAYNSPEESMTDYYEITCSLSRYANGVSYGTDRSKWKTAKETVTALHAGGYATDGLYVQKIMNTINGRDLTDYDLLITGEGDIATLPNPSIIYTESDILQGTLVAVDGGRTYSNNMAFFDSISTNWDTAKRVDGNGTITIRGIPANAKSVKVVYEDAAATGVLSDNAKNGDSFQVLDGYKIGFTIYYEEDIDVADVKNLDIVFSYGLPAGQETFSGVLAHFVKIE